jgi:membrane-associated phospholipid phosphatase
VPTTHRRVVADDRSVRSRHDRVRAACVAGALACLAVFVVLRIDLIREHGETSLDRWVAEQVGSHERESPTLKFVERVAAAPGSVKGSVLICFVVGAWAWLRARDLRWGLLLTAAFTVTTATVGILKIGIPLQLLHGDLDRAYLSAHAANTTAVFGMLLVMSMLTHDRMLIIVVTGAIAGSAVALVAFSVMAAGHHWLTDVINGSAVAGVWLFALAPAARAMWRRPELVAALRRGVPRSSMPTPAWTPHAAPVMDAEGAD